MRDMGPEQGAALQTFSMVGRLIGSGAPAAAAADGALAIGALPVDGASAAAEEPTTAEAPVWAGGSDVAVLADAVPVSEVAEHEREASSGKSATMPVAPREGDRIG
jgi:hypothetical protein